MGLFNNKITIQVRHRNQRRLSGLLYPWNNDIPSVGRVEIFYVDNDFKGLPISFFEQYADRDFDEMIIVSDVQNLVVNDGKVELVPYVTDMDIAILAAHANNFKFYFGREGIRDEDWVCG